MGYNTRGATAVALFALLISSTVIDMRALFSRGTMFSSPIVNRFFRTNPSPSMPFSLNSSLFNSDFYSRLVSFWFLELPFPASAPSPMQMGRWFGFEASSEDRIAFDEECRAIALQALISVGPDNFTLPPFEGVESDRAYYDLIATPFFDQFERDWDPETSAENALALILLFDQMTRNIFRTEQALIYAHYDRIARAIGERVWAKGLDSIGRFRGSPPHRMWYYYPWMHSESLGDHKRFAQKLEEMRFQAGAAGDEAALEYLNLTIKYREMHEDILMKFGRYAYRNKVLGRTNTAEEDEYMASGPNTFGA